MVTVPFANGAEFSWPRRAVGTHDYGVRRGLESLRRNKEQTGEKCARRSFLADILRSDGGWIPMYSEEVDTRSAQIDDLDSQGAEPVDSALKRVRLSPDHASKAELSNQTAAIPARRQCGDHGQFAIAALAAGVAKSIGFAVQRRIAVLYAPIVAGPHETSLLVKNRRADGNSAFGEPLAGFAEGNRKHCRVIVRVWHLANYTPARSTAKRSKEMRYYCSRKVRVIAS